MVVTQRLLDKPHDDDDDDVDDDAPRSMQSPLSVRAVRFCLS